MDYKDFTDYEGKPRFSLKHKLKVTCPTCGQKKRFKPYVDLAGEFTLPDHFGVCDREDSCGHNENPYKKDTNGHSYIFSLYKDNDYSNEYKPTIRKTEPKAPVNVPVSLFRETIRYTGKNTFIENLKALISSKTFTYDDLSTVNYMYRLGSINGGYMDKALTIPFINKDDKVRAIQVKCFDEHNNTAKWEGGKGKKQTTIIHHALKEGLIEKNFFNQYDRQHSKFDCLFGEHLLKEYPLNPIILVESPKTCIYGTLFLGTPDNQTNFLWLSTYNLQGLTLSRVKPLEGRTVLLLPDTSESNHCENQWRTKVKEFKNHMPNTKFIVKNPLSVLPKEQQKEGLDVADLFYSVWKKG